MVGSLRVYPLVSRAGDFLTQCFASSIESIEDSAGRLGPSERFGGVHVVGLNEAVDFISQFAHAGEDPAPESAPDRVSSTPGKPRAALIASVCLPSEKRPHVNVGETPQGLIIEDARWLLLLASAYLFDHCGRHHEPTLNGVAQNRNWHVQRVTGVLVNAMFCIDGDRCVTVNAGVRFIEKER